MSKANTRLRQITLGLSIALIASVITAGPANASSTAAASDAVAAETACTSSVTALLTDETVAGNIADPNSGGVQYLCASDAVQITDVTSDAAEDYTVVEDTSTGAIVDLTGLTDQEKAAATASVDMNLSAPATLAVTGPSKTGVASTTVNSQYRSSGSTIITYGVVGQWSAQVRVSMWISLAWVSHTLEVTYQPLTAGHTIHMDMPMRMQRTSWLAQTVDSTVVSVGYYSSAPITRQFRLSSLYQQAEKYYPETYNNKLWDMGRGTFNVNLNFRLPTFQCYKTVQCKYPNGAAA